MSAIASAPPSPLGQLEPSERATVIRTLRERLPAAEFDGVLTALVGRLDEVAAQTLSGRRTSSKIASNCCCWTPSTTRSGPWW